MDAAADYHALTLHRPGLGRRRDPRLVHGFLPMDPARRPPPFKRYKGLELVPLPRDLREASTSAVAALSGPTTAAPSSLDFAQLSRLLFYGAGVVRVLEVPGVGRMWFRAAGSAGNLAPLEVYVVAAGVDGLDDGVYHYEPVEHALTRLGSGAGREGPTALVLTGVPWRTGWKYAERGFRHLYWDAGTMLANLLALAESAGVPGRVLVGFSDAEVNEVVGADGVHEFALAVVTLGPGEPSLVASGPASAGALASDPMEFPLVTATQRAGDLTSTADVERWRATAAAAESGPPPAPPAPPSSAEESVEAVIRRRGSTRAFDSRVTAFPHLLRWAMGVATRPLPADFVPAGATLLEHHLAVHAVEEVDPGGYRWEGEGRLEPRRPGNVRFAAAHLCLDQELGGSGAYTAFHCADLDAVLGRLAARGYRAAQLEAGVVEGRLHLAAFTLGFGATGLTFFDEEVRSFFATNAYPMLVTAVGAPAYRSRPGGLPGHPTRMRG